MDDFGIDEMLEMQRTQLENTKINGNRCVLIAGKISCYG